MHKFTTVFIILFSFSLKAQQVPQKVINATGSHFTNSGIQLTTNIGEPVTTLLTSPNNLVSQGFIQPLKTDVPTSLKAYVLLDNNFTLYPNPSISTLILSVNDNTIRLKRVDIYAENGQLILSSNLANSALDISALADGIYWIRPISDDKEFGLKQFVKTN